MKYIQWPETNRHTFAADVFKLVGGTTFAQALSVLAAPILTRLYNPDAFGVSSLYLTLVGLVAVVACLRYQFAIVLPEKDEEAANVLGLSLILAFLISALTVPLIWFGQEPIILLLRAPELGPYLWLLPFSIIMNGTFLALTYWCLRKKQFSVLSAAMIISSIASMGLQICFGLGGYANGLSIILASLVGLTSSTLILIGMIFRKDRTIILNSLNRESIFRNIRKYKRFPVFDTWAALLDNGAYALITIIIYAFYSSTIAGYLSVATRIVALPTVIIGSAVAQVFFQRVAQAKKDGNLSGVAEETLINLAFLGIMPFLILSLVGKEIFIIVFGSNWAEAGIYVQIFALPALMVFLYSPMSMLFSVLEQQRAFLLLNALSLLISFITLFVGCSMGEVIYITLIFYSSGKVILWGGSCLWILRKAGIPISRILKDLGPYFACTLPSIIFISLAKWVFCLGSIMILFISVLAFMLYYLIIMWSNKAFKNISAFHIFGLQK